jgi:hypothetical protein
MIRHLTRIPGVRRLWAKIPIGSVALRTEYDVWDRPHYAYGVYTAAQLARSLGLPSLSVIEFGVAGGDGLLALEHIADRVGQNLGIRIAVFGFDTGEGMPPPVDYRDLPHVWQAGFYSMDQRKLRSRLTSAELVLGDVAATVPELVSRPGLPPVGFVAFDLDYYSSTKCAFKIFDGPPSSHLPRTYCYFDDIVWPEHACYNEYTGELCAIREFNAENDRRKIGKLSNLAWMRRHPALWNEQIYVSHDFDHPLYCRLVTPSGDMHRELRL